MPTSRPAPPPLPDANARPRAVDTAFWCWLVAAVLTAALGLITASQGAYGIGGLLVAAGLAQGYLAGRTRRGDVRFARAATGLALATVVLLALLLVFAVDPRSLVLVIAIPIMMVLLIVGAVLLRREPVRAWFGTPS
jgi:hypothetical protein